MLRLVFAFALLALLAVPAPAMAKELTNVGICGPDACAAITGETNLHDFGASGEPDGSVPAPGPFYEIRFTVDAEGESQRWSSWYVPSAKRLERVHAERREIDLAESEQLGEQWSAEWLGRAGVAIERFRLRERRAGTQRKRCNEYYEKRQMPCHVSPFLFVSYWTLL